MTRLRPRNTTWTVSDMIGIVVVLTLVVWIGLAVLLFA